MKRILFALVVLFFGAFVYAQIQTAVSYESITVADTAVGIGASTLTLVLVDGVCSGRLETAQVRFRVDGTDPTASEGVLIETGDFVVIRGLGNLTRFKAIRTGGSSGTLKIHCYQ